MRIHFERTGGFAGMKLACTVDSETLPSDEARRMTKLADAAKLWDMPAAASSTTAADQFQYKLLVEADGKQKTITTTDASASDKLQTLLDWLTDKARKTPRA